jgi:hypothetical protein
MKFRERTISFSLMSAVSFLQRHPWLQESRLTGYGRVLLDGTFGRGKLVET